MKEISFSESKEIQVKILQEIHKYCQENKLKYFLVFGTLIGAVRHKGFIPWDDDIDVAMPRKDYEFFMHNFSSNAYCRAVSCETDSDYYLPFGKVFDTRTRLIENIKINHPIGVYVDVFPIDSYSDNDKLNEKITKKLKFYRGLISLRMLPGSKKRKGWKRVVHSIFSKGSFLVNMNKISVKMNRLAESAADSMAPEYYGIRANIDERGMQRKYPVRVFEERVFFDFEGYQFLGSKEYDLFLTMVYGDYMKLPPENQRISHHEYQQYWL